MSTSVVVHLPEASNSPPVLKIISFSNVATPSLSVVDVIMFSFALIIACNSVLSIESASATLIRANFVSATSAPDWSVLLTVTLPLVVVLANVGLIVL